MERVKSRNEVIMDLTAPLAEKCVYKVSSQGKAWELIYILDSLFCLFYFSSEFLENNFLKEKRRTDPHVLYELGKPYLRSSKLLACWNQLRGIWIETRNAYRSWFGGWVERGSSQVIWPSIPLWLLMLLNWVWRFINYLGVSNLQVRCPRLSILFF